MLSRTKCNVRHLRIVFEKVTGRVALVSHHRSKVTALKLFNPHNFIFLSRKGRREIIKKEEMKVGEKGKKERIRMVENRGTVVGKLPNCEAISVACLPSIAIGFTKVKGN